MLLSLKIINLKGSCFWLRENIEFYSENSNFGKTHFSLECVEDLAEIELQLQIADCNENQFNLIALNTQNIELQDEAEGTEDLHPDFSENYDLFDDLDIASAALNNEQLKLNELLEDDYRQMVQITFYIRLKPRK